MPLRKSLVVPRQKDLLRRDAISQRPLSQYTFRNTLRNWTLAPIPLPPGCLRPIIRQRVIITRGNDHAVLRFGDPTGSSPADCLPLRERPEAALSCPCSRVSTNA